MWCVHGSSQRLHGRSPCLTFVLIVINWSVFLALLSLPPRSRLLITDAVDTSTPAAVGPTPGDSARGNSPEKQAVPTNQSKSKANRGLAATLQVLRACGDPWC